MILYLLACVLGSLIGGALFMLLPVAWDSTSIGQKYVWLSMFAVKRGAFVLQDDGELNWKKFKYDPIGSEKVSIGGETVTLSDPARALQSFKGKTVALADETHGVIFRLSDAFVGSRKEVLGKKGLLVSEASKEERNTVRVSAWIRKYMSITPGVPVDLRDVRYLATGSEKGTDSWLVRTWFKFSRIRDASGTSILKIALPFIAFIATLIVIWQAQERTGASGTGNSGGNNSTTLNLLWIAFVPLSNRFKAIVGAICVVVGLALAYSFFGLALVAFPISFGIGLFVGFVGTTLFVLFISLIGMGAWLSTFFLDMGLQTFDSPTIWETDDGMVLEDRDIEGTEHKLGKHYLTFVVAESAIEARDDYAGSAKTVGRITPNKKPRKEPKEGGAEFGHFIPAIDGKGSEHYVTTFGAVSSLRRGFIGNDTNERHKEAKEEFGDGISDVSSYLIIGSTFVGIILAAIIGYVLL